MYGGVLGASAAKHSELKHPVGGPVKEVTVVVMCGCGHADLKNKGRVSQSPNLEGTSTPQGTPTPKGRFHTKGRIHTKGRAAVVAVLELIDMKLQPKQTPRHQHLLRGDLRAVAAHYHQQQHSNITIQT
eukprot:362188-Chlamydomonas_euryale.AAC.3